jgi:adenosylcobinamide-GDP ribazoletransferase
MFSARRHPVGRRSSEDGVSMANFIGRLRRLPEDVAVALSFFSRVPVDVPTGAFDLSRVAGGWPAAGLLIAVAPATVVVVAAWLNLPALVTAFLAIAAGVAMTGALHEDGLADSFDGLGGGGNAEKRLAIMRDSRLGTFGALALFLVLATRGAAFAVLAVHPSRAVLALLAAAMVSRAMALWHWSATSPARRDGMAFAAGQPDTAALQIGLLSGLAGAIVLVIAFGFAAILGLVLAALATGLFSPLVNRRIGGHTGDTIGAAQQIAETLLFVGLSSVSTTILV